MIDKQKQIEEMAKVIEEEQIRIANTTEGFQELMKKGVAYCHAKAFYNTGYRNCKDKVVLTKEQYKELTLARQSIFKMLDERDDKARKETARGILKMLYTAMPKTNVVVEIKRQYGVEVDDDNTKTK